MQQCKNIASFSKKKRDNIEKTQSLIKEIKESLPKLNIVLYKKTEKFIIKTLCCCNINVNEDNIQDGLLFLIECLSDYKLEHFSISIFRGRLKALIIKKNKTRNKRDMETNNNWILDNEIFREKLNIMKNQLNDEQKRFILAAIEIADINKLCKELKISTREYYKTLNSIKEILFS
jgi:hypothetical protein